jgi:N4-gp56 family major capsid protein
MALVNRASLPAEFIDVTSALLLIQPLPQYFHAMLLKMALSASAALPFGGPLGLPIPGRQVQDGGAAYNALQYNQLQLAVPEPAINGAIAMPTEVSQRVGHTIKLNRPTFGSGGFTLAAREIPSGTSISVNAIGIGSQQTTLTVKRYGGPYDPVNNTVAPIGIDRFDAGRSVHSESQMVGLNLQKDLDNWLDQSLVAFGNLGATTLWPGAFTSDNNSVAVGDMAMDCDTLFRVTETMGLLSIPTLPNGQYFGVMSPTDSRQLKNDPQFITLARNNPYAGSTNPLFQKFIGRVGNLDLFESASLISTNNTNSIPIRSSQFFGAQAFGAGFDESNGGLPHTAFSVNDNYGESALVIWLTYMALGILNNSMIVNVHTS